MDETRRTSTWFEVTLKNSAELVLASLIVQYRSVSYSDDRLMGIWTIATGSDRVLSSARALLIKERHT
jgi:hypothetical protein